MLEKHLIGAEGQPLCVWDDFSSDPDALRRAAGKAAFEAAAHHYPGLRAKVPADYWADQLPLVRQAVSSSFGSTGEIRLIDHSFSMVTRSPAALSVAQRLPHCDAFSRDRIALVHFLSPVCRGGTAFFRHRSTGFETVDQERRPIYFGQMESELRRGGVPAPAYMEGDTDLFERIFLAEARYNRALLYRSWSLHSGAIAPGTALATDPRRGRLTITAFLSVG